MKSLPTLLLALLLLLIPLLLIQGCAGTRVGPAKPIDLQDYDAAAILDQLNHNQLLLHSVKGLSKVRIYSGGDKFSFKQVVIADEPAMLYLEILSLFGRTEGKLISDGSEAHLLTRHEHLVFDRYDDFDLSLLYPAVPAGIGINFLVSVLLGKPHLIRTSDEPYSIDVDSYLLLLTPESESIDPHKLWFDPITLLLKKYSSSTKGGGELTYKFSDYMQTQGGVFFPRKIALSMKDFTLKIDYDKDVEINIELKPHFFTLSSSSN